MEIGEKNFKFLSPCHGNPYLQGQDVPPSRVEGTAYEGRM